MIYEQNLLLYTQGKIFGRKERKPSKLVENRKNLHRPKNEIFHWIPSVNVIKSGVSCGFGHIYWRYP